MGHGHGHVLLLATGVGEAEVHELDFVFLHHLHDVCDGLGHQISWVGWMVVQKIYDLRSNAVFVPKLVHSLIFCSCNHCALRTAPIDLTVRAKNR
jgi:hypothetical protein